MGWVEQSKPVQSLNQATHVLGCMIGFHDWTKTGTEHVWACRWCPEMKAGRR